WGPRAARPPPPTASPARFCSASSSRIAAALSRRWNVSSSPIKPTWVPFTSTASTEQILDFSLLLMSDTWSGPRVSSVIYLGDVLHVEASVAVDNHVPLRLYVDSCIATLSGNKDSEPRYAVVDKLGCLMDSKAPDSSSSFTRPALNKLRFDITAFRFQGDSRSLIYVTCTLRAVNADKPADASNKACSYQKQTNRWVSEDGSSAVCGCCDAGSCSGRPRFLPPPGRPASYGIPSGIHWRRKWPQKNIRKFTNERRSFGPSCS
ncbi:zona pellucida sperm-binding protein 3-like, partial [Polyodon spathula]|uniref:zona pellucida sperm-binding protein 3-like n=1 Tax=Polyodon spathula TaxID=7913 RepID=UPI001B7E3D07